MPVKQLVPTKSLDKNFKVLDSQLARVGKHVTPGQFCEIQTLAIEGSCGEIDPIKLVELISSRSKGFRGIVSRKTKQLAESHPDVSVEVVAAIAKKHVALFTLQWLQEELKGESLTIENAAGYLGLKEDASDMLGVVGELGKIMRVSGGDVETLKAVVALEAATGGEDLVTLQGIIDAGELYVVRGNEGEITGVMGLIYDNENGIHIHRLGILGDAYGRGVGEKLVKKARERAKRTGRTAIKLTCSSLDAGMTAFYEQHGFQMTGEVKDYYGLKEDLLFLQLGVTEDSPRKSKDGKKLKDEKLPVKLDGFRHNGVYMVQDHKTLQNLQHIEKKSYPKTPEGLNTFAMMADAGGVVVAKDAIFRPEAFCYFFHDKDGETLHLHGVPTKEKGLDVALIKALPAVTSAKRMVCKTFPSDWLDVAKVMLESGAVITGIAERQITGVDSPVSCPVFEWDFTKQRSEAELESSIELLRPHIECVAGENTQKAFMDLMGLAQIGSSQLLDVVVDAIHSNFKPNEMRLGSVTQKKVPLTSFIGVGPEDEVFHEIGAMVKSLPGNRILYRNTTTEKLGGGTWRLRDNDARQTYYVKDAAETLEVYDTVSDEGVEALKKIYHKSDIPETRGKILRILGRIGTEKAELAYGDLLIADMLADLKRRNVNLDDPSSVDFALERYLMRGGDLTSCSNRLFHALIRFAGYREGGEGAIRTLYWHFKFDEMRCCSLDVEGRDLLAEGGINPELRKRFKKQGVWISQDAVVTKAGDKTWKLEDRSKTKEGMTYWLEDTGESLEVYEKLSNSNVDELCRLCSLSATSESKPYLFGMLSKVGTVCAGRKLQEFNTEKIDRENPDDVEVSDYVSKLMRDAYAKGDKDTVFQLLDSYGDSGLRKRIVEEFGVMVLDASSRFTKKQIEEILGVLYGTPKYVLEKGAVNTIVSRHELILRGAAGDCDCGGRIRMSCVSDSRRTLNHEIGHGVHFNILTNPEISEFCEITGWKVRRAFRGESLVISDNLEESQSDLSYFPTAYSRTNWMEDFAECWGAFMTERDMIYATANYRRTHGNDKLWKKLEFVRKIVERQEKSKARLVA